MNRLVITPKTKIFDLLESYPFLPAPLIDKAIGLGYQYWINEISEEKICVYFKK